MQQRFGFTKGMRQSISPNKADAQSYYDAMNKRVVVDNKSGTAALTDEPGTRLIATIPSTKPVYTLELDATSDTPNSTVTFYLSSGNIPISIVCARDINLVYSIIMANATLALAILGGSLYVGLKGDKITVVYLDDTSGGLTEVGAGLTLTTAVPSITDAKIIATASIREDLILFTRSGVYGQIWKCRYNSLGTIDVLTPNNNLVYNGHMYPDVLANYEIFDIVGRYDNSELVKIYWSNCVDNINHININNKESLLLPIELLSITPDCNLSQPRPINVLSGGLYNAGMVQYGYQLYNLDGAETVISSLSGLIHLTESSSSASSSMSYKGAENGAQVGKAVTVTIEDIDPRFDFIKVIAVYYTSEEGEPEVNVIAESNVPQSKTLTIIDAGDTVLSVYTPAQLASIGTKIFTAKLLTTKDNILIAGNITDQYFDIDEELGSYWDARAYRFKISSSESQVKYDGGTYEAVDATFLIGGEEIPETHDCHLDKSAQSTFKYKPGTNVLGGAGKNVIYDFFVRSINLDTLSDPKHVITTAAGGRQQWGDSTNVDFIEEGYTNNNSFTNYASPINQAEIVGYQRDEMYRFGLVVFDGKGRQSFVKWIADIKMPAFNEGDNNVYYLKQSLPRATQEKYYDIFFNCIDGTGTYANVLGINFTVNTSAFPSDWKFAIVRSRREDVDKTIVAQGTAVMSTYNSYYDCRQPIFRYEIQTLDGEPDTNGVFYFYSPETKFTKNFNKTSTDRIRFLNIFGFTRTYDGSSSFYYIPDGAVPPNRGEYSKFYKVGDTLSRENLSKGVDDVIQTDVSASQFYTVDVAGTPVKISNYAFGLTVGSDEDDKMCFIGSNLALGLENDTKLGIAAEGQGIVNYERTLLTQYGGFNYNAKQNSTYQLAGKIRTVTGGWDFSRVFGGDTFIEIFDFLQTSLDAENNTSSGSVYNNHKSCIYIPVETTINLALRYDTCPSKDTFAATEMKLQETIEIGYRAFSEGAAAGAYPSNLTDLYLYNRVYSKQPTAKTYVGMPLNFRLVEDRDCDVTNSEKHISGELTDSWTRFLFNNKLTVNTSNGPLTKLLVFRNQVMFWQDKAFGLFSFNDRKVITDPNGSQLILGVGSVLDYFQYLSEKSGTGYTRSVVDSGAAIYYYDDTNHKLMMTQGGKEESISDIADCAPLFKRSEFDNPVDVVGVFDKGTRRVLEVIKDDTIIGEPSYTETTVKYGLLYNWYAATDARLICADGWEVPTTAQWQVLTTYMGSAASASIGLKETGTDSWITDTGINSVGFNGRGAGIRVGIFSSIKSITYYRSRNVTSGVTSDMFRLDDANTGNSGGCINWLNSKDDGASIRLIKTTTALSDGQTGTYTGNDGKVYRTICIGTQEWLADNLCETKFRNGDYIHGYEGGVYTPITDVDWAALTTDGVCAYNDTLSNAFTEVTISAVPASYSGLTVGFNERLQAFESIYSFVPNIITSHDGRLIAIDYLNPDEVYEHNDEDNPNEFYGQAPAEGFVTIVAGSDDKKVFTNVEFNSVAKNDATEYPLVTVDNMKLHNSYLESTKIPLTSSNLRRRFRTWRLQLPKTVEIPSGKSRYMDYYLGLTLYNTPTNNANLRLEDVTLYYLIPML